MTGPDQVPSGEPAPPDGHLLRLSTEGAVTTAQILAEGQVVAASGRAVEAFGVFVYDQISTDLGHRRRGLGRAIMQALASRRSNPESRQVLVATEEGRTLYETLGWRVCCPYMTAVIPG
jgi:GNAT superfamily N-acetyltransferase